MAKAQRRSSTPPKKKAAKKKTRKSKVKEIKESPQAWENGLSIESTPDDDSSIACAPDESEKWD